MKFFIILSPDKKWIIKKLKVSILNTWSADSGVTLIFLSLGFYGTEMFHALTGPREKYGTFRPQNSKDFKADLNLHSRRIFEQLRTTKRIRLIHFSSSNQGFWQKFHFYTPPPPWRNKEIWVCCVPSGARVALGRIFLLRGQKSLLNALKCVEFYRYYKVALIFELAFIFLKLSPTLCWARSVYLFFLNS